MSNSTQPHDFRDFVDQLSKHHIIPTKREAILSVTLVGFALVVVGWALRQSFDELLRKKMNEAGTIRAQEVIQAAEEQARLFLNHQFLGPTVEAPLEKCATDSDGLLLLSGNCEFIVLVDNKAIPESTPPGTESRTRVEFRRDQHEWNSATIPIRKNECYKVFKLAGPGPPRRFWVPFKPGQTNTRDLPADASPVEVWEDSSLVSLSALLLSVLAIVVGIFSLFRAGGARVQNS